MSLLALLSFTIQITYHGWFPPISIEFWVTDFEYVEFLVIGILVIILLFVSCIMPILGYIIVILSSILAFLLMYLVSEGSYEYIILSLLLFPPGTLFLIFGLELARLRRAK